MDTSQLNELIKLDLKQFNSISHFFIAYSGGLDSHVLLHLCASNIQIKTKLTAVYIDHGLQPDAESWGKHCESVCQELGINFLNRKVNATAKPGKSKEEAARNARYAEFKSLIKQSDVLLTAHHAEDQLETVLLHLFRGGGLKGLSGIPASLPFSKGRVIRPLLDVAKAQILDYAKHHELVWIEDLSNKDAKFDRNFLRNDIIPLLKQRWPSLANTVSRSSKHCANAQGLLNVLADDGLITALNLGDDTLSISRLQKHSSILQALIIRQWFQHLGLKMPSEAVVQKVLQEVIGARADATPLLSTQDYNIRRYRDKLYGFKPSQNKPSNKLIWSNAESTFQITDEATYEVITSPTGIPAEIWQNALITVAFRSGGETLELPGRNGHHEVKKLMQEAGIPPWERAEIPLIYLDGKLAAVGEYWISAGFYCDANGPCLRIFRQRC